MDLNGKIPQKITLIVAFEYTVFTIQLIQINVINPPINTLHKGKSYGAVCCGGPFAKNIVLLEYGVVILSNFIEYSIQDFQASCVGLFLICFD